MLLLFHKALFLSHNKFSFFLRLSHGSLSILAGYCHILKLLTQENSYLFSAIVYTHRQEHDRHQKRYKGS